MSIIGLIYLSVKHEKCETSGEALKNLVALVQQNRK